MSHEHHPDGRLRLAAVLLVSIAATTIQPLTTLSLLLFFSLLAASTIILRGSLSLHQLAKRLAAINVFVLWIWLVTAIDWPEISVNDRGILLAAQITLRVNIIAISASVLLDRMSGIDLARAMVGLGLPQSLGALVALAIRAIAHLAETRARLEQAMRARAYQPKVGWRSLQVSSQMVAWLIIHALVRSERLELGLRSRGASSMHWPTRRHGHWNSLPWTEWAMLGGIASGIAVAVILTGPQT